MIRIANGQGFWGDCLEAPVRLVEQGPIDYLILDYLAEVTMSIVQKQKQADPTLGYARDFPPLIGRIAAKMKERRVRVVANAGGVNPIACAREVKRLAPELKVAVVLGDDVFDRDSRGDFFGERVYRGVPVGGGVGHGSRCGDCRTFHRYRFGAGSDGA